MKFAERLRELRDAKGAAMGTETDCPLDRGTQTRNLLLYAACTGLIYLSAPVAYVGVVQASLCRELGASDGLANLPGSCYFLLTAFPLVFAWLSPAVAALKRNVVACFAVVAASQAAVALALVAGIPDPAKIAVVIAQAAAAGALTTSAVAFLWEIVGRGVGEARRGLTLGLAFGAGPVLAAVGSLGSQLILKGELGPLAMTPLRSPLNFAVLYATAAPAMVLATLLATRFVVPLPERDAERRPFAESVFGGVGDFLRDRLLRTAIVVTFLVYIGNNIASNFNLYSKAVYGDAPMLHAGYQNFTRFGFKVVAGALLGWLLSRTNPKAGLLATSLLYVSSLFVAMTADASTYLLVFGIYGAGELVGVYAPNYILSASRKEDIRRNMAVATLVMAPTAPAGYLFGVLSDVVGARYGEAAGYRASFAACAAVMLAGIALAAVALPARPRHTEGGAVREG